jgi:endonuclease-3
VESYWRARVKKDNSISNLRTVESKLQDKQIKQAKSRKMQKSRKRKQPELNPLPQSRTKPGRATVCLNKPTNDPYPTHPRPTPEECRAVRDDLLVLHGFPQEFAKYRRQRPTSPDDETHGFPKPEPLDGDALEESVLDGLVKTVLSQNTTEVNSQRAFDSLKSAFPTWEDVCMLFLV